MTMSAPVAAISSRVSWRTGPATSSRGSPSPSRARHQVSTATVSSAEDSRKCELTMYGLSPVSTVMPPTTALPMTIQNWAQPSRVRERRTGVLARAAMITSPMTAHRTYVSMRLPNSMAPWMPMSEVGVRLPEVHLGQVSQPSPDWVSRTAPPVTTMTTAITTVASAARSTKRAEGCQRRAISSNGFSEFGTDPS